MYNTGNPIGSTAPKDFSDNSEITDRYVNDVVNETTLDRFGRSRLTLNGIEKKADDVIANLGFFPPVDYTSGLTVDNRNFTVTYNGIVYAAQPSAVPFTTGAWDAAQWYPIQNVLNQKNILVFDTYAEAQAAAATLPDGQAVFVEDSVKLFTVSGGLLTSERDVPYFDGVGYSGLVSAGRPITRSGVSGYQGDSGVLSVSEVGDYVPTSQSGDDGIVLLKDLLNRNWKKRDVDGLDIALWGAKPVAGFDNMAAFFACMDWVRGQSSPQKIVFTAGVYEFTESPNWAWDNLTVEASGAVHLKCTGSGDAVRLEGAATPNGNVYNCDFGGSGRFIVSATPTGGNGVYYTSFHHSKVKARVIGAGTTKSGYDGKFAVCTTFDIQCTKNGLPGNVWLNGAQPAIGFSGTELNPGELLSYCYFPDAILEHTPICAKLDKAFGNTWIGGTLEGASSVGLFLTENAFNNKFYTIDFEVNADHDIYCLGRENFFVDCDTEKQITIDGGAVNNVVKGGSHNSVLLTANAIHNKLHDFIYNRYGTGTITDNGIRTEWRSLTNRVSGIVHNALGMSQITVGASPFTYTNTTGNPLTVTVGFVSGLQAIEVIRPGVAFAPVGASGGQFRLCVGDQIKVAYSSAAPTMFAVAG